MLGVTDHAVERYIKRWRPGLGAIEARAELQAVADNAAPTKRNTLVGDARLYMGTTPTGEQVPLAVRGDAVITVLEAEQLIDMSMSDQDLELLDDSRQTVEACRAMAGTGPHVAPDHKRAFDRQNSARDLLARWKRGEACTDKALAKAHEALGLVYDGTRR